jgi:long-chain acyl-CoA synthetase
MREAYDERPWLARYAPGQPAELEPEHASALAMFAATVRRLPDAVAIRYRDEALTHRELDERSSAVGAALVQRGVARGDRVALQLQNVPEFVIAVLAAWKVGAIAVPVNPMLKEREVRTLVDDCEPALFIAEPELPELAELARAHAGQAPPDPRLGPDDIAFLTYTSGTTGPPKGAMNTHGNVVFSSQTYREWVGVSDRDVILGAAPLFHITGLVAHLGVTLLTGATLVLSYRFEAETALDLVERHRVTFTTGAITVFIALMNAATAGERDTSSLRVIVSGGAPISPSTVEAFEDRFGTYIHNIYGLTETTSPSHCVPIGSRAPVDPASGALSVGVPVYGTVVRVVDEQDREVPVGEVGELVTSGPQVVPGYWGRPEESERAIPGGRLRTGDVGFMDPDGWFYVVDRKKDQINAAGFKVWPREVEDVLYGHPAVREVAVVGVPDDYRGETVKAFVSLRPGERADADELIAFCRERMAAYKYPRLVEFVDELPKTASGKVLRRVLRDHHQGDR